MKKWFMIIMSVIFCSVIIPTSARAASGMITFSTETPQPVKGDIFTVVCQVTSDEGFTDTDFYVLYDSELLSFQTGGKKVSGGKGLLHISSLGNTTAVTKRTFSLQFKAKRAGSSLIEISDTAKIYADDGVQQSVSSNQLSIQVTDEAVLPQETEPTPAPVLSNNNRLKVLEVQGVSMTPAFDPTVQNYQITVDCNTARLLYHFEAASRKSRVRIEDNENLREGDNAITIRVISESGKTRKYLLTVRKESEAETKSRVLAQQKQENTGIAFQVNSLDGTITLKNATDFTVLNAKELEGMTEMPAGYIATKILVDGIEIPVYTMQNDLENDFVLLYLQAPNGEKGIYQFDRRDKTIQRYTGDMVAKINKSGGKNTPAAAGETSNPTVFYVIIAILVLIILGLLIAMLKLLVESKRRKPKGFS